MRKSLKELELSIPVINLLESRKISGGYDGDIAFEQTIEEVIIIGNPEHNWDDYNTNESEQMEDDDPDIYREENDRDNEMGMDGQTNDDMCNGPTVQVPDGYCVLGTIASAVQVARGCSNDDAIKAASDACKECGLNPDPNPGCQGIKTPTAEQMYDILQTLGFDVVAETGNYLKDDVINHFKNGGVGIGYINGEGCGHMVYLENCTESNGGVEVEYYDAVTGEHGKLDEFPAIILFK